MGFLFALLFIWLPCAFYASHVAADKGHNGAAWFFGGFLFGPIALVAAAGLGDQKLRRYQRFQAEAQGFKGTSPPQTMPLGKRSQLTFTTT